MAATHNTDLTVYFISSFLNEHDLKNTMKLYTDKRNKPIPYTDILSSFHCLRYGHRAWSSFGNGPFNDFQENRHIFRTANDAKKYFDFLIANNSRTKPPDNLIRNDLGDICYIWIYTIGTVSNPDSYYIKYYIREKSLITLIRVNLKTGDNGGSKKNLLLEQVPPYVRLALIKSAPLLKYFAKGYQLRKNTPVQKRGISFRKFKKS